MKNRSPVKPNVAGKKTGKKGGKPVNSAIRKAKNVPKQTHPKNAKTGLFQATKPTQNNNMKGQKQNGSIGAKQSKNKKFLNKKQPVEGTEAQKANKNKMPVINEISDDEESDAPASRNKIASFGGTAALDLVDYQKPAKARKNKNPPESAVEPSPKKAKIASAAKQLKEANKKLHKALDPKVGKPKNKRKVSLLDTLKGLRSKNDLTSMQKLLPSIADAIDKLQGTTKTAKRKLRQLLKHQQRIVSGDLQSTNISTQPVAKRQKNKPQIPKGMLEDMSEEEENEDDGKTWVEKLQMVDLDDDESEDAVKEESENDEEDTEVVNDEAEVKIEAKHPTQSKRKELKVVKKAEEEHGTKGQTNADKKKRYVVFVGNVSYQAKEADIEKHFSSAGSVVSVRIIKDAKNNSKGCCHVEFDCKEAYEKGLSLHHTQLHNRQINVMFSPNPNQKGSPQGGATKKNSPKVKAMKFKGMQKKGLLAGSKKGSQKRSDRRKRAAGAKNAE